MLLGIYDDLLMGGIAGAAVGPGPSPIIGARQPRLFIGGLPNDYTTAAPVIYSDDGLNFFETVLPDTFRNHSIGFAWGNDITLCLADHFSQGQLKSFISKDYGATWNTGGDVAPSYNHVSTGATVFANGLFVTCVDRYSQSGMILTSPDGIVWSEHDIGFNGYALRVWYVNNRFFVTGFLANSRTMAWATSQDGISWARMPDVFPPAVGFMGAISYLNGKWVVGGLTQNGYYPAIAFSTDLSNWTISRLPWPILANANGSSLVSDIVYFNGKYYAGGWGGSAPYIGFSSSPDLMNWTNLSPGFSTGAVRSINLIGSRMVVTGEPYFPTTFLAEQPGNPLPTRSQYHALGTYTFSPDGTVLTTYPQNTKVGIVTSTNDGSSFAVVPLASNPFWTLAGSTV